MGNLAELVRQFKPRREFSCSHTTLEVDSVFVRVAKDKDTESWIPVANDSGVSHYIVSVRDIITDPSVIRGARVSTDRDDAVVDEKAQGMVNFLWRDVHVTPFEGINFRLRVTTPISYAHPFFRVFAATNELSGRYTENVDEYHVPSEVPEYLRWAFDEGDRTGRQVYASFAQFKVAKELLRLVHPYRFMTKFYMTISLRHLLEMLSLGTVSWRQGSLGFDQTRQLIHELLAAWTPWAYQAWQKHPRRVSFDWVPQVLSDLEPSELQVIEQVPVLNRGYVRLCRVDGDDLSMLRCLDDFPDPRRAFGHAQMHFELKVPIHVLRQLLRHRYGHWTEPTIPFDEIVRQNDFFIPERFRQQEGKVGAYTYTDIPDVHQEALKLSLTKYIDDRRQDYCTLRYHHGLDQGLAGMLLPYSFYAPAVWTVSVEGLMNLFSLRCDSHAQYETKQYANVIWGMFCKAFPRSAQIFARHLHYGDSDLIKALV